MLDKATMSGKTPKGFPRIIPPPTSMRYMLPAASPFRGFCPRWRRPTSASSSGSVSPGLIFAGRYDYTTPSAPVISWYDRLTAPSKRFVWFENSAHMMYEEEPGRALVHLVQDALPFAAAAGDVAPEATER